MNNSLLNFFVELRRRRVCRAATMYAVAMWIVCQIVDMVPPEMGLPAWTLQFIIVLGLVGLPIALILSWMFDITPDGLVVDTGEGPEYESNNASGPRPLGDRVIDCSLLLIALVIGLQLAAEVLIKETVAEEETVVEEPTYERIAVLPFQATFGADAGAISTGLVVELQYEIHSDTELTVVAGSAQFMKPNCLSLAGAVSVTEDRVYITATLIENATDEIIWARAFDIVRSDAPTEMAALADEIVAALPIPTRTTAAGEVDHVY